MFDDYMERKGVWDNNVWTDINGVMRYIKNMNSMHLCFVYKQCELSKNRGIRQNRLPIIRDELQQRVRRGEFSKEEFYSILKLYVWDYFVSMIMKAKKMNMY